MSMSKYGAQLVETGHVPFRGTREQCESFIRERRGEGLRLVREGERIWTPVPDMLATDDAKVWAEEFVAMVGEHADIPTDVGCMIGWFANAMTVAVQQQQRRVEEAVRQSRGKVGAVDVEATPVDLAATYPDRSEPDLLPLLGGGPQYVIHLHLGDAASAVSS